MNMFILCIYVFSRSERGNNFALLKYVPPLVAELNKINRTPQHDNAEWWL